MQKSINLNIKQNQQAWPIEHKGAKAMLQSGNAFYVLCIKRITTCGNYIK